MKLLLSVTVEMGEDGVPETEITGRVDKSTAAMMLRELAQELDADAAHEAEVEEV